MLIWHCFNESLQGAWTSMNRANSDTLSGEIRLRTDLFPFRVQSPAHTGLGTGVVCAVILVTGAIALVAYSYFRLNQRTTGFQRFEVRERAEPAGMAPLLFALHTQAAHTCNPSGAQQAGAAGS